MSIIRFDPFADLLTTLRQAQGGPEHSRGTNGRWVPAVDIYSNGKQELVLKAELPDMKREDIQVVFENNTLTIKGEKKKEEEVKQENYYRSERSYGAFVRTVDLPKEVHADKVKASFKDGVLEVRMPKTEEAKTKEIKVKVD